MAHHYDMARNLAIIEKCEKTGEPFFVMRAQDCLSAALVHEWALRARNAGVSWKLVQQATDIAEKMRMWATKKIPD